ncbi:MAG: hypothetical protein QM638_15195 [Nocardioides sp.]|uniref:hypothetical protein n=1 Tax=Nocardioides sp. TaxID=35761 RepID=UPI0039E25342
MTNAQRLSALASAALLAVAVTACASSLRPTTSPSSTRSLPSPTTATSVATPPSASEAASRAASNLVTRYYATVDQLGQQLSAPLDDLSAVAAGVQLNAERTLLKEQRRSKERQIGDTRVARLEVQSVNLDNSDPSAGKVPTVELDVCWDVSKVDVVNASGKSIVSKSRADTGWTRLIVANYHYATDPTRGWRVATGQDLEKAPCAAS